MFLNYWRHVSGGPQKSTRMTLNGSLCRVLLQTYVHLLSRGLAGSFLSSNLLSSRPNQETALFEYRQQSMNERIIYKCVCAYKVSQIYRQTDKQINS